MADETNVNKPGTPLSEANTQQPDASLAGDKAESEIGQGAGAPKKASSPETAENNDKLSAEELAAFRKWQESQKSDAEKQAAAIGKAEKARLAAEEKAAAAELKLTAMSKGVSADALDDVIALAKTKITDKVTAEQAIDEIIRKYPAFAKSSEPGITTGVRTGGNTPPASSAKAIDIIRSEQVKRK